MAQGQLNLSDNEFWTHPYKTRDQIESELMNARKEALLVDAPREVRIDARETAPVVVLRVTTIANAIRLPFREVALATAVDLGNNYTYADPAIVTIDRGVYPSPRGVKAPPPGGMNGEAYIIDLRRVLQIPWQPQDYLVTLLLRDQPSDRLRLRLTESEVKYQDPEVLKFREQERNRTDVPALFPAPSLPLPSFRKSADSPAIPDEPGIALSAPRVLVMTDEGPCVLRGSFRLPILRRHIVPPASGPRTGAERILAQLLPDDPVPTGVIPITLVATGSEVPQPFVWRLIVPTYDPIDPAAESPLVTGHFAIDLQSHGNVKGVEQTLFLYGFSAETMAGPLPIAFVSRSVR